jgi:cytoskeletal protein RodZ
MAAEAHEPVRHPVKAKQRLVITFGDHLMFKKLVPVIALALIAGPVFAADAPATTPSSTDQSSSPTSKPHHKKHKKSSSSSKSDSSASKSDSSSTAPAK